MEFIEYIFLNILLRIKCHNLLIYKFSAKALMIHRYYILIKEILKEQSLRASFYFFIPNYLKKCDKYTFWGKIRGKMLHILHFFLQQVKLMQKQN